MSVLHTIYHVDDSGNETELYDRKNFDILDRWMQENAKYNSQGSDFKRYTVTCEDLEKFITEVSDSITAYITHTALVIENLLEDDSELDAKLEVTSERIKERGLCIDWSDIVTNNAGFKLVDFLNFAVATVNTYPKNSKFIYEISI